MMKISNDHLNIPLSNSETKSPFRANCTTLLGRLGCSYKFFDNLNQTVQTGHHGL